MFHNHAALFVLVMMPVLSGGCGGSADSAESEPAAAETMEETGEAGAADTTVVLVNPNLASEEELASVPEITAEVAAALVGGRPYLRAADLHAVLSRTIGDAATTTAYESLWLPINLNDVTREEILLIPGVGDRVMHKLEEYRPYEDMDEFRREIGKYVEEVERLARYVYVPIDLNAATREAIMAVPGMSERMAHEFEEYRPYTDLGQFRREIGKYVDADEVARFERYVTLN